MLLARFVGRDMGVKRDLDVKVTPMTPTIDALVLDLLEWVARQERSYEETMDAWRTSCPRLPVWEHATDERFIRVETRQDGLWLRT